MPNKRLTLGFGVMLALLTLVALVGLYQLSQIQFYNSRLGSRAIRLSLAQSRETQVKLALPTKSALPASDAEPVGKLKGLVEERQERQLLDAALVEQMAAAASSLKTQADELVKQVSVLRVGR